MFKTPKHPDFPGVFRLYTAASLPRLEPGGRQAIRGAVVLLPGAAVACESLPCDDKHTTTRECHVQGGNVMNPSHSISAATIHVVLVMNGAITPLTVDQTHEMRRFRALFASLYDYRRCPSTLPPASGRSTTTSGLLG